MNTQQRWIYPSRPLLTALLAATVSLAVGVTACSSSKTATAPVANGDTTTASATATAASPKVYAKDNVAIGVPIKPI